MEELFQTLKLRKRPEDIAQKLIDLQGDRFTLQEMNLLKKAASGSIKNNFWKYSSMADYFAEPIGAKKQMDKAIELFKIESGEKFDPNHIENIQSFIEQVSAILGKNIGNNNFLADRKNKQQRKDIGLDLSKRAYNKRWRLLVRLENKLLKYIRECKKSEFQKIAKHGIVHQLDYSTFASDVDTACFVAYYTARCNLRSEFTVYGQTRPFDEICEMLMKRLEGKKSTNWWAVAHVYPSVKVLSCMNDEQKGELLGKWTTILQDISLLLQEVWKTSHINRSTMIVKKGNDSTTWNNTAGAWNKARDNWMNLVYATGTEFILDNLCFGKVMRLMAADVVYWHRTIGNDVDPNTYVWNSIPLPWKVFEGKASCNKDLIINACKKAGIDPEKSGWIAPREHTVVLFTPTPELVHGVTVYNPFLANVLKKHGCFSGKILK